MTEKTTTFVIKGEDGKKVGEQTVDERFTPVLVGGQRAEMPADKAKSEPKAAEPIKG